MLKEKQKFYLVFTIILAIGVVLIWQGIINGRVRIDSNIYEIQDKKTTINAYSQREEALPMVSESYNSAKSKVDKFNDLFVDENSLPDFIGNLESIAAQASVSLEKSFTDDPSAKIAQKTPAPKGSPVPSPASKEAEGYVLRLSLKGGFAQLMNFISRLESMPYYVYIKSVSVSANTAADSGSAKIKKESSEGELQSIMIIKVFKKQNFNGQK